MAQQNITIGTANAHAGDTFFDAFSKTEANFTDLYTQVAKVPTKTIMINSTADLPAAFDQDDTCYVFGNTGIVIPSGGMECTGDGIVVTAYNEYLQVTYNGTGDMFYGSGVNITFTKFSPQAPSGRVFNFVDPGNAKSFFANKLVDINCDTMGFIGDYDVASFELVIFFANQGLSFSGSGGLVRSLSRMGMLSSNAAFVAVDLGTSVSELVEISRPIFFAPPGGIAITGAAASANITADGIGKVDTSIFRGGITPVTVIDPQDLRWKFTGNPGVEDSRNDCNLYFPTGTTDTITVANANEWYEIGSPTVGGWATDISNRFTVDTATGVITYIGINDLNINADSIVVISKSGGGADVLQCRVAKNWTGVITDSGIDETRDETQNSNPASIHPGGLISLQTNDNLRLIFSNTSSASNIIVDVSSFRVFET